METGKCSIGRVSSDIILVGGAFPTLDKHFHATARWDGDEPTSRTMMVGNVPDRPSNTTPDLQQDTGIL